MSKRPGVVVFVLLFIVLVVICLLVVGCYQGWFTHMMGAERYPGGFHFYSYRGTKFQMFSWFRDDKAVRPCPIVLHVEGNDLDEKTLSDTKALKALGWEDRGIGHSQSLAYRTADYYVGVTIDLNGVLRSVDAGLNFGGKESAEGLFSINGARMSLPVGREQVISVLGEPLSVR